MDDPIGSSLEFLAGFDLFSLVWNVVRNLLSGPTHTFFVPIDCGMPLLNVVALLKQNGVKNWGHLVIEHMFTMTVKRADAARAQYVLDGYGIPVMSKRVPSTFGQPQPGMMPRQPQPVSGKRSARSNSVTRYLFGG